MYAPTYMHTDPSDISLRLRVSSTGNIFGQKKKSSKYLTNYKIA